MTTTTHDDDLLTIDQLAGSTGLTVRTTRYYASLGLLPPPIRRGRMVDPAGCWKSCASRTSC